jgi:tetratricopeptide (TPR) repeat protein
VEGEKVRAYANALYNRELYPQAVETYQRYLDLYHVNDNQRANINFVIGNIYFERLHDYENAMAYFLKIKHLFPESELMSRTDRLVVECLERLQRSADAKQALDEATSLEPGSSTPSRPGEIIAKIGDREITSGDLAFQISQLPDYVQSQFQSTGGKREFLRQFIATELFYDAAKRKGLDRDKEVTEGTFQAKKSLMVQRYLQDEIAGQVQLNAEDIELYFKANQEKYAEKDKDGKIIRQKPLDEVRKQVAEDLLRERQQKAYEELMARMMRTENVQIFDDLVR